MERTFARKDKRKRRLLQVPWPATPRGIKQIFRLSIFRHHSSFYFGLRLLLLSQFGWPLTACGTWTPAEIALFTAWPRRRNTRKTSSPFCYFIFSFSWLCMWFGNVDVSWLLSTWDYKHSKTTRPRISFLITSITRQKQLKLIALSSIDWLEQTIEGSMFWNYCNRRNTRRIREMASGIFCQRWKIRRHRMRSGRLGNWGYSCGCVSFITCKCRTLINLSTFTRTCSPNNKIFNETWKLNVESRKLQNKPWLPEYRLFAPKQRDVR